jgi:hypothetical protein
MCIHACFDLFFCGRAVVLDVSVFEVAVEAFKVEEGWDVGVRGGAVVAFVEVVCEDFPVIVT